MRSLLLLGEDSIRLHRWHRMLGIRTAAETSSLSVTGSNRVNPHSLREFRSWVSGTYFGLLLYKRDPC